MIRHGATMANATRRYLGRTDEALSLEGIKVLSEYKRQKMYPVVDMVFASPMKRCIQTAQILYSKHNPVIIPEWVEIDFGAFEGKNYIELKDDKRYQAWIDSNGTMPFPDGESRDEFICRCEEGFKKMISNILEKQEQAEPQTVGMIVHGGTIMAILSRYTGGDYYDFQVANGRGYVCTYDSISAGLSVGSVIR